VCGRLPGQRRGDAGAGAVSAAAAAGGSPPAVEVEYHVWPGPRLTLRRSIRIGNHVHEQAGGGEQGPSLSRRAARRLPAARAGHRSVQATVRRRELGPGGGSHGQSAAHRHRTRSSAVTTNDRGEYEWISCRRARIRSRPRRPASGRRS